MKKNNSHNSQKPYWPGPELFVPQEIALLAHKHKFDYGCLAYYDSNTLQFNILGQENEPQGKLHYTFFTKEIIQVPMYQQLINWFREEHNIVIYVEHIEQEDNIKEWYYNIQNIPYTTSFNNEMVYGENTYYGALDKALIKAFKLIK